MKEISRLRLIILAVSLPVLFFLMVQAASAVTLSVQDAGAGGSCTNAWPASIVGNYSENGTWNGNPRYDSTGGWYIYRVNIWGADNWVVSRTLGSADYNNTTIAFYQVSSAATPPLNSSYTYTNSGCGKINIVSGGTATPPPAPTIYSLDPDGDGMPPYIMGGSTIVYWSSVTGAVGYKLDVATDSLFTSFLPGYNGLVVTGTPIPTYATVSGLTSPGTTYYFRVRSYNSVGDSGNSGTLSTTAVPSAPTATAASGIYGHEFQANWNAQSGASYYKLYVCTDSGFSTCVAGYNPSTESGTSASVTGLSPAVTYYYRLRASNENGDSGVSNTISLATNALPALGGSFTTAGAVNDNSTLLPFTGVTVSDANLDNVSVTITYDGANGTLTGTGLSGLAGSYVLGPATQASATADLQALVFHPTLHQAAPGSTVVTTFSLTPNDGKDDGASNSSTVVTTTMVNAAPAFIGATTTLTVSQNAPATDIRGLLHISDTDSGQTETWTQNTAPNHGGTLSFTGATASSGSTDITPGGTITYAPATGYSGAETFTVQVSDTMATADRTITVTVVPPPTVMNVSPSGGQTAGGTSVTITGTNFAGATAVAFGGIPASSYTVNSATQITANSPAHTAGTVDITVTTAGGTSATSSSDQFTYVAPPTVTAISPDAGPTTGGTSITITGTNFTGATGVRIGINNATSYTVDSSTQITATSPGGFAGTVDITVSTAGGTSATGVSDRFTYVAAPTVTGISPSSGPTAGGTSVTITGTNLTGAAAISFGGTNASGYTVDSATQITATTAARAAGAAQVTVTTVGGTSSDPVIFTYVAPPAVTSVSVPADATYVAGQNLDFTANFSAAVTVDTSGGTPYIPVTLNTGGTVHGAYISGSGTSALTFRYTVVTGNADTDGITVGASIMANGATLRDAVDNNAVLTLNNVGSTVGVLVDAIAPEISISSPSVTNTISGPVDYTITYTGADTINLAEGDITLNATGTATGTVSVSGGGGASRTVTISGISGSGTLGISIAAGTANDAAYNSAPAAGPSTTFIVCTGTSIAVTDLGDGGPGTLRQAIAEICPGGSINFSVIGAIELSSGELVIDRDMTISGPGAGLTISGNNASRVFTVNSGATATVQDITVANGVGNGGGFLNNGTLTVTNCTISGNSAGGGFGGGILNNGTLTTTNCTISGNSASGGPGGMYNNNGTLTVTNCTISGNSGGGIRNTGTLTVTNSIIAANPGGNCTGAIADGGNNIDDGTACGFGASSLSATNPMLGALADNGGATNTMALLAGSPAINAGDEAACPETDQRGITRPQGANCDIGAYEFVTDTTVTLGSSQNHSVFGQSVTFTAAVTGVESGTPAGTATFFDGATAVCSDVTVDGSGQAACSTQTLSTGLHSMTAAYSGDASYTGSTSSVLAQTVNQASTTTMISSHAPDPSIVGQAVSVAYTVTADSPGSGIPTGNVTVSDGINSCTASVTTGSCSIILPATGPHILTATYEGDTDFSGSVSPGASHTVTKAGTSAMITSHTPDPSVAGQAFTVSYAVGIISGSGVVSPNGVTPTGNVTVSDGVNNCTATVAAGSCSITIGTTGTKSLTANYAGDTNFIESVSPVASHTVNKAETTTAITSDAPDPSFVGQAIAVAYTVTASAPGSGFPAGNVTVSDGVNSCTGTVAAGSCSLTLTTAGARTLTATYAGDANFNGSNGTAVHAVSFQYLLSVSRIGSGAVTAGKTGVEGNGINCGADCSETFNQGTVVILSATAANGWKFNGWSGDADCSDGEVTVNSPLNCTATFVLNNSVTVAAATGNGNIILSTNSPGCGFIAWGAKTEAQVGDDALFDYPYGLVEFTLNCAAADVTITFPGNIGRTTYRKYGPTTPGNAATTAWYTFSNVTAGSSSITLHLTDGELGDDTAVNGIIVDQGGPGQKVAAVAVPAMNEWGMTCFALLAGICSLYYLRIRRRPKA